MKRAILIATGTLGGLGAVLAITPPRFGPSTLIGNSLGTSATVKTATLAPVNATPKPKPTTATHKPKPIHATPKPHPTKATPKPHPTKAIPIPQPTKATPTPQPTAAVSGSFLGAAVQNRYGVVQVKITVENGKITAALGVQMPNRDGQSASISQQAQVYLIQETLAAQSANIQGVGGASYTSLSWKQSLASAVAKAGL